MFSRLNISFKSYLTDFEGLPKEHIKLSYAGSTAVGMKGSDYNKTPSGLATPT